MTATAPLDRAAYDAVLRAARPPAWRRAWRTASTVAGAVVTLVVLVLVGLLVVIPLARGGTTLTVLTGSMVPTYRPGDVLAVRGVDPADACTEVAVGDVVTYLPRPEDPALVSHRVVGKGSGADGAACSFVTQGDHNPAPDDPVQPRQVRAVVMYSVPWVGHVRQWAGQHATWVVRGLAAALVVAGLASVLRPTRRRVVQVVVPVDPRIRAACDVADAWRARPEDATALAASLDALAAAFEPDPPPAPGARAPGAGARG